MKKPSCLRYWQIVCQMFLLMGFNICRVRLLWIIVLTVKHIVQFMRLFMACFRTQLPQSRFFFCIFFSLLNSRLVLLQVFCSKIRHYVRDQNCFQWSISLFLSCLCLEIGTGQHNMLRTTGLYINISVPRSSSLSICIC